MKILNKIKIAIAVLIILELAIICKYLINIEKEHQQYEFLNQTNASEVEKSPMSKDIADGKLIFPEGNMNINGKHLSNILIGSSDIKAEAVKITSNCTTDLEKAKALYAWVALNINYNNQYVEDINNDNFNPNEGTATDTFKSRNGVCVGFASLYFVMAKDIGLKVRMIMGQGFGGEYTGWANHTWNEVYIPSLEKWVTVDATFANGYVAEAKKVKCKPEARGVLSNEKSYNVIKPIEGGNKLEEITIFTANYFNNPDFSKNHRRGKVIAEWKA